MQRFTQTKTEHFQISVSFCKSRSICMYTSHRLDNTMLLARTLGTHQDPIVAHVLSSDDSIDELLFFPYELGVRKLLLAFLHLVLEDTFGVMFRVFPMMQLSDFESWIVTCRECTFHLWTKVSGLDKDISGGSATYLVQNARFIVG